MYSVSRPLFKVANGRMPSFLRGYSTFHPKPSLSNFKIPATKVLLTASLTYYMLNVLWWRLETEEKSLAFKSEIGQLNAELDQLIDERETSKIPVVDVPLPEAATVIKRSWFWRN